MNIIILGTGCTKCHTLEKMTRKVNDELKLKAEISSEGDITKILSYGIMRTPGLVIDGKVAHSGHLPSEEELIQLLTTQNI